MKTPARSLLRCLSALALIFALTGSAQAQTPDQQTALTPAVAELQKNPADTALRERIIKLAAEMNPAPAIPEDAKRFMVRGIAAMEDARNEQDFTDAAAEFAKALQVAPWLANGYRNLAIAQDKAGAYNEALGNLNLYLLSQPEPADAEWVKQLGYKIEYRRDKAAKEAQLAALKAAEDARKAAEEARAKAEADKQRQAAEAATRAEQERRSTIEGTWQNGGSRVVVEKQGAFYRVSGLDSIFDLATYRRTNRTLTGTATPMFDTLKENFESTPQEVLRQAEGKVSMQCSLTLSDDGLTLSAERDNCAINYSRTAHPILGNLDSVYKYVSIDRAPAFFVYSLTRASGGQSASEPATVPAVIAKPEMIAIPAGTFDMGSASGSRDERPVTRVTISKPFWLGKTEETQAQWQALMGNNPSNVKGADRPVEQVSWNDAMQFCQKLTEHERSAGRLPQGCVYTLPTEAQWEYACRAGTTGDYAGELDAMAWYDKNGGGQTHPVGQKQANAWGLYDMHGNVCEWCLDWYAKKLPGGSVTDPAGPSEGTNRVVRGGCWFLDEQVCRSAFRVKRGPDDRYFYLNDRDSGMGFRLALTPSR